MPIAVIDQSKSTKSSARDRFLLHYGPFCFRFTCILFGFKHVPGATKHFTDGLLIKDIWQCGLVYMKDIVIVLRMPDEPILSVRQVSTLVNEVYMTLSLIKCEFFTICNDYFDLGIRPGYLEVPTWTNKAIRSLKCLTSVTEIRPIAGTCNVFRQFLPSFG